MTKHMTGTRKEWLAARLETGAWFRRHDEYEKR
jgi:hypothetical protein